MSSSFKSLVFSHCCSNSIDMASAASCRSSPGAREVDPGIGDSACRYDIGGNFQLFSRRCLCWEGISDNDSQYPYIRVPDPPRCVSKCRPLKSEAWWTYFHVIHVHECCGGVSTQGIHATGRDLLCSSLLNRFNERGEKA